jgi:acetyltransferase-like isoleucine patch superfamily enzyme
VIGDDCWLATGCIILPGVKLGNHVIVAAGAVVTRSFEEDNIILGGTPAKIVKRIGAYSHRDSHA